MTELTFNVSMYSKVDVDVLNAVKSMLADVSSVSPLSEQREKVTCTFMYSYLQYPHVQLPSVSSCTVTCNFLSLL